MSGFDANNVYNVSVHDPPPPTAPESASDTEKLLLDFLLQYRVGGEFIYRCASSAVTRTLWRFTLVQGHASRESSFEAERSGS